MTKPQSPIHRPLDDNEELAMETASRLPAPPPTRTALLAQLDSRALSGRVHSLGPGGASSMFSRAVEKALVDEMAAQLRGNPVSSRDVGWWARDIIAAFREAKP